MIPYTKLAFPGGSGAAMWETWVRFLGWEDPLEEGVATHSSILAWRSEWQEYWSGRLRPPPGDLPNPGIEPRSPASQADSLPSEHEVRRRGQ